MSLGNPGLNAHRELRDRAHNLFGLPSRDNLRQIVVHLIAQPATSLEIGGIFGRAFAHGDFQSLERSLMVPLADHAITGTRNDHFGQLQCRVVRDGETSIVGKPRDVGVLKITGDDGSQVA